MEPRYEEDYSPRYTEAAKRALVDVMQVLASYRESIVLVGGWVPELQIANPTEPHIGSIDVDLALDVEKLREGKYAEMLGLLLATRRYRQGRHSFQLLIDVDLGDGEDPIEVAIDFLASQDIKLDKNRPPLLEGFRVLQADGCSAAFLDPNMIEVTGKMAKGANNTVSIAVSALEDFLIMKSYALRGRDKPKDAYDICYCLDEAPGGIDALAREWRRRIANPLVQEAIAILSEKFASADDYGPQQVVELHNSSDPEEQDQQANKACFLVQEFLDKVQG